MAERGLRVEVAGPVATLAIERPRARNALDRATLEALTAALGQLDGDEQIRAVVLRGASALPFSAGYDLGNIDEGPMDEARVEAMHRPVRDVADAIAACRHPVVVAIRDYALGAALDIAAHADLRVATDPSRFALPAARLGFTYPIDGVRRFAAVMGLSTAEALLLEAREFSGQDMQTRGFLHRLWPADQFEEHLAAFVDELCALAPLALRGMKQALRLVADGARDRAAEARVLSHMTLCLNSADAREGKAAFRERRRPVFTGR